MYRDAYHHIEIHRPPLGGMTLAWIEQRLANARALFLQRLGITSPRLRGEGMRLRVTAPVIDLGAPAHNAPLGVTTQLTGVSGRLHFAEALYLVDDAWLPIWRGETHIWAEDGNGPQPIPEGMQREAATWVRLVRGSVPVMAERGAAVGRDYC